MAHSGDVAPKRPRFGAGTIAITFDTSIAYTPNPKEVVATKFAKFLEEFSNKAPMRVFVPELVLREIIQHKLHNSIEAIRRISSSLEAIKDYTGREYKCPARYATLDKAADKMVRQHLRQVGAISVPTPYNDISVEIIEKLALKGLPPFKEYSADSKHSDKGIKDYLILQTMRHVRRQKNVQQMVIIVADGRLSEALIETFGKDENVTIFGSVDDCTDYLREQIEQFSKDKTRMILKRATKRFFDLSTKSGLYYEANVKKQIQQSYEPEITSLRRTDLPTLLRIETFEPAPSGNYRIGPAKYSGKRADRFLFNSPVRYLRTFIREFTIQAGKEPTIGELELELHFNVEWSARIGRDLRFLRPKFEKLSLVKRSVRPMSDEVFVLGFMDTFFAAAGKQNAQTFDNPTSAQSQQGHE